MVIISETNRFIFKVKEKLTQQDFDISDMEFEFQKDPYQRKSLAYKHDEIVVTKENVSEKFNYYLSQCSIDAIVVEIISTFKLRKNTMPFEHEEDEREAIQLEALYLTKEQAQQILDDPFPYFGDIRLQQIHTLKTHQAKWDALKESTAFRTPAGVFLRDEYEKVREQSLIRLLDGWVNNSMILKKKNEKTTT